VLKKVPNAKTPWGPIRHYYWDRGHKMDFVNQLQKNNPLLVAEWDPQISAAFPLVPLNQSGTMWLASHRKLPEPAKVLLGSHNSNQELHLPSDIKPGELFAATLDFMFDPTYKPNIIKHDSKNHTVQTGWIEISYLPVTAQLSAIPVSQRIPLVIPENLKHTVRLRMILPLQVPLTFPESTCLIWFHPTGGVWQSAWSGLLIH
jgi:hypothetical protein